MLFLKKIEQVSKKLFNNWKRVSCFATFPATFWCLPQCDHSSYLGIHRSQSADVFAQNVKQKPASNKMESSAATIWHSDFPHQRKRQYHTWRFVKSIKLCKMFFSLLNDMLIWTDEFSYWYICMYDYHKNVKAMNLLKIRLIAKYFDEKFSCTFKLFPWRVGVWHTYIP